MNHTELVARFFESNEEFAQHVNKGTVEFAEWRAKGEPEFVPPSDDVMDAEVQQEIAEFSGDNPEAYIREILLPDLAQQIAYIKTTVAAAYQMCEDMEDPDFWEPEFYDQMEIELHRAMKLRGQLRLYLTATAKEESA